MRLGFYFGALVITHFADLKLGYLLRKQVVDRLARAPLGWFTETNSGRVRKSLHDDIKQIHHLVAHAPVEMTTAVIQPVLTLAYAFFLDWRLGLLAISTIPVYAVVMAYETRGMGDKTMQMDTKLARISTTMLDFVAGITVVKAFGRTGQAHRQYREATEEFRRFYIGWCGPLMKIASVGEAVVSVPLILAINLAVGAALITAGWVEPAQVMATTLIALLLPRTITIFATLNWSYQTAGAAAYRIVKLLNTEQLPSVETGNTAHAYDVEFKSVTFGYAGEDDPDPAVKSFSLRIPQGNVTALIGPSGSGKSTVASLLARFFDVQAGAVFIGGVDIRQMDTRALYKTVGFVLQNSQLVRASIRDNISLGRPEAVFEDIVAAAKAANIHEEIVALPNGYDTVYGDEIQLSGGQRGRIAIARVLLMDTPILILDEATAYTDPEAEAQIQRALTRLAKGRTVLVIGHKPEVIKGADQIVVLDNGCIAACGTHQELSSNSNYQKLMRQSSHARQFMHPRERITQ